MIDDDSTDKILSGELNREDCDGESVRKFPFFFNQKEEQKIKLITRKNFQNKGLEQLQNNP